VRAARLLARTVRGIESVTADEIRRRGLGQVERLRHREVWFTTSAPGPALLQLRTADDLFLLAAVVPGVGRSRRGLHHLAEAARAAPAGRLLALRRRCGGPDSPCGVAVTASFLGRRNYSRFDIEDAVGEQLAATLAVAYHSRRGGSVPPKGASDWRVTVEGDQAVLALRVAPRPLHRRAYKLAAVPATLHPPLAAALSWLAAPRTGDLVLDPCCGAGTIPIEAALGVPGAHVLGLDRDPAALRAAKANASRAGAARVGRLTVMWGVADAGRLPVVDAAVDVVIANPPWGRQARPSGLLAGDPGRFWHELRRVLAARGRAVVLLDDAAEHLERLGAAGLRPVTVRPLSLAGAHPAIVTLCAR
jgi:tRNA (guanine6-N2)-methyltransferase